MKGFASVEKDGHAGELGSTGIRIGDLKYQVRTCRGLVALIILHAVTRGQQS